MKKEQAELYHVNYLLPLEIHRKFKMIAASRMTSVKELYLQAALDYLEREEVKGHVCVQEQK